VGTAVASDGTIYTIDRSAAARLVKIVPGTPNTVTVLADATAMWTAIDGANGTAPGTAFNARFVSVAADGDVIVGGFITGGDNHDTVLSINSTTGAVSVVYTAVDAALSQIDGIEAMTTLGNDVYVATSVAFGAANSVWKLNSNDASAPNATVTELVNEAALIAALGGGSGEDVALNALASDGTNVFGTASFTATASDDVVQITPAGVTTLYLDSADIIADLAALDNTVTDIGFNAIAIDGDGTVWLTNPFGDGTYDTGLLWIENVSGGTGTTGGITGAALQAQLGGTALPFFGNDGLAWDAANSRIIWGEDGTGQEGVAAGTKSASVNDWMNF
jgi:hypothetical protein